MGRAVAIPNREEISVATIEKSIDIEAPISTVYNQWTQFEDFPQFMEGVTAVRQLDDTHLQWTAEIGGEEHTWKAEITNQEPDRLISWRAVDGKYNSGRVTFEPLDPNQTRINVEMTYDAEGMKEALGSALGFDSRTVSGDLDRFKEYIEERHSATGRWRGEVHGGTVTDR
jgi:uncharacterized membrane protein